MPNFSGTWTAAQQFEARSQGIWPKPPNAPVIQSATAGGYNCLSVTFTAPSCAGYPSNLTYTAKTTPGCFTSVGSSSPLTITGLTRGTSYTVAVKASNSSGDSIYSDASNSITAKVATCASYTSAGTYSWIAPAGVTSVSVVAVGAGGWKCGLSGGGGGGGLGYKNNIAVTPGNSYSVVVGGQTYSPGDGGDSYFIDASTVKGGGGKTNGTAGSYVGVGGGNGGAGANCGGAGGAGGYSGAGGNGNAGSFVTGFNGAGGGGGGGGGQSGAGGGGGGGGVGLYGQGTSGLGGSWNGGGGGGSGGTNGLNNSGNPSTNSGGGGYKGGGGQYGGGSAAYSYVSCARSAGGGAVRIVWCKDGIRGTPSFPSTNVGNL